MTTMQEVSPSVGDPTGSRRRHVVRLPGFIVEDGQVGLGDIVKRATSLAGIRPCGGCQRRAEAMNRWLSFSGPPGGRG
jgi:hypothetical protein